MKKIGEEITWNTANGPETGTIEKVTVRYTVKLNNGREMTIYEQERGDTIKGN